MSRARTRLGTPATETDIDDLRTSVLLLHGRRPPAAWAVWVRPLGYLLMTLVWASIFILGVGAIILGPYFGMASALDGDPLSAAKGFAGDAGWLKALVAAALLGPILGAAALTIALAAGGLALGSATLFIRSLNPHYRHEQLSFTLQTVGETIGGPQTAHSSVALSLLPIRLTRWFKIVQIIEFNGWIVNGGTLGVGALAGLCATFTLGWIAWPVSGVPLVVCIVVSALLLAATVRVAVHRLPRVAQVMPQAFRDRSTSTRGRRRRPRLRQTTVTTESQPSRGSSTNTAICRSVFVAYSA